MWQFPRLRLFLALFTKCTFQGHLFLACYHPPSDISKKDTAAFGDGDPMVSADGWQIWKPFLCLKGRDGAVERFDTWTRGVGCTRWGESTDSYPGKLMAKGLLCSPSQLTGGKAISLNYMALW